jgi:hypothetical protein
LSLTEHTLREGVYRCTGCNELHLDASDECVLECDADMEPVEVVAASQLRGAVEALRDLCAVDVDAIGRGDGSARGAWQQAFASAQAIIGGSR